MMVGSVSPVSSRHACALSKYEWSRVVAFVGQRRKLQCLALCSRDLADVLSTAAPWAHAAARLGAMGGVDARSAVLTSLAYRSDIAEGLFLNSLHKSGCDVRPMVVRVEGQGSPGGAFGLSDDGDVALVRRVTTRKRARWRRFYGDSRRGGGGAGAGAFTEIVGLVASSPGPHKGASIILQLASFFWRSHMCQGKRIHPWRDLEER